MTAKGRAWVGLGANLAFEGAAGPDLLQRAVEAMRRAGLHIVALSSVWETEAWPPGSQQPNYHNAVAELDRAAWEPEALYAVLRGIETQFGRARRERWGPRTLDLDLLALDEVVGRFGAIEVPHPRLHERAFVLAPLLEVAPDWVHPGSGLSAEILLAGLSPGLLRRAGTLT